MMSMPRYSLRTLLILLAVGPMVLAGAWWGWIDYRDSQPLRHYIDGPQPGQAVESPPP